MASWFYRLRAKILIGSFALLLGFSFLGFNTTQASNAACLQQLGTASMNGTNIVLNFEVSGRYILKIFSEPEAETQVDVILPIDGNSYQPPAEYQPLFGKKGYTFVVQPIGETADSIPCLDDYPYNPIVENLIDDIFEFLNCPASAAASTSTAALALSAGSEVADTSGNTAFVPDPACTRAPECPEGVQAATENSTNRCEIYSNICGVPASGWTLVDRCPMDMAHHFEIQGLTAQVRLGDVVSFTVNATDRHGNLSNDYQGTVRFASGDDGALLPMDHVFVIGDAGSFAAAVTFNTPGVQTLTVQDMNNFNILGTIQVEVIPGLLCAAQVQPAVDPLGDNCTDFANPCLVPAGWTTVNTCGGFPESCGQDINNDSDLLDAGEQCDNGTVDGMCYNNDGCNNCMNADIITCPAGSEVVCGQCVTLSSCGEDADTTDGLPGLLDAGETCDNGQVDGVCYNNDGCNNCEVASVVDCDPGSFFQCGVCVSEGDFVTEEDVTLDFWVSGDKEIYAAGDIVTYTVYIENNNTVALRNVVVGGTLEPGFAFNTLESEGSALAGIEWVDHTLVGAAGLVDVATVNNQDFDFAISDIEPGERRQYKYSVDILIGDAAPAAGSYDNAVSLDADFIEAVVSPSDTIRIIGNAEGSCRLPGYSQLDVATDGTYLYVLIWDDNNDEMVYKFDPSDCSVIDTYVAGGPNGGLFGLAYDGSKFWASGHQSLLYGLDDQFIIDSTKNLRIGGGRGAAFADGLVWVMHDTDRNEITATDITTTAARIKFRMPNFIKPFGFAANDQALWVAADRNIYALSKQDGSILHTIDMPTFDGYITGLTILGDDLWVVDNNDDHMYRITLPVLEESVVCGTAVTYATDENGENCGEYLTNCVPSNWNIVSSCETPTTDPVDPATILNVTRNDEFIEPQSIEAGTIEATMIGFTIQNTGTEEVSIEALDFGSSSNQALSDLVTNLELSFIDDGAIRNRAASIVNGSIRVEGLGISIPAGRVQIFELIGSIIDPGTGSSIDGSRVKVFLTNVTAVNAGVQTREGGLELGSGIADTVGEGDCKGETADNYLCGVLINLTDDNSGTVCAEEGVTSAISPDGATCTDYATPCEVPRGWTVVSNCETTIDICATVDLAPGTCCDASRDPQIYDCGEPDICATVDLAPGTCCDASRDPQIYDCEASTLNVSRSDGFTEDQEVIAGTQNVTVMAFDIENTGPGDVVVNEIDLSAILSGDIFQNVNAFDAWLAVEGTTHQALNSSILPVLNFENIGLAIAAGSSKTVTVKASIATPPAGMSVDESFAKIVIRFIGAQNEGTTIDAMAQEGGLELGAGISDTVGDGDCDSATADNYLCGVQINLIDPVPVVTPATVLNVTRIDGFTPPRSIEAGETDVTMIEFTIQNTGTEAVTVNALDFRVASDRALSTLATNLELFFIEGTSLRNEPVTEANGVIRVEGLGISIPAGRVQIFELIGDILDPGPAGSIDGSQIKVFLTSVVAANVSDNVATQAKEGAIDLGTGVTDTTGDGDCEGGTANNYLCGVLINLTQTVVIETALRGDANNDGTVNDDDITALNNHLLSIPDGALTGDELMNADLDGDCDIDATDRQILSDLRTGTIANLPDRITPEAQCATITTNLVYDPTADNRADIDRDGDIDSHDYIALETHNSGNPTAQLTGAALANADVNGDCRVDSADSTLILQYTSGSITQFPARLIADCSTYVDPQANYDPSLDNRGDINTNGSFESTDISLLTTHLATSGGTLTGEALANADVDGNCLVNNIDISVLMDTLSMATPVLPNRLIADCTTIVPGGQWVNTPDDFTSCPLTCNAVGKVAGQDADGYPCASGLYHNAGLQTALDYRHGCIGTCSQILDNTDVPTTALMSSPFPGQTQPWNLCEGTTVPVGLDLNTVSPSKSIAIGCYCE